MATILYHLSVEKVKNGVFSPRIPQYRVPGEDAIIKRVCFSKSIENCVTAMPNGCGLMTNLVLHEIENNLPAIAYLYSTDESLIDKKNLVSSSSLARRNLVPDARVTQEVWVVNQQVKCEETVVRIKYTNTVNRPYKCYNGNMVTVTKEVGFERSMEPFERHFRYKLYTKRQTKIVEELAKQLGCTTERKNALVVTVPPLVDIRLLWERVRDLKWNYLKRMYKKETGKNVTFSLAKFLSVPPTASSNRSSN